MNGLMGEWRGQRITELEDRTIEITQYKQKRENKLKKKKAQGPVKDKERSNTRVLESKKERRK